MELVSRGDYLKAIQVNQAARLKAESSGNTGLALRLLSNTANCWFALARYRRAMEAYLEARALAKRTHDWEMFGGLSANISSLYLQTGEVGSAAEAAREGLKALRNLPHSRVRTQLWMQAGRVKAYQGDVGGAAEFLRRAVIESEQEGDLAMRAEACGLLGHRLLRAGRTDAAEGPLLEEFRYQTLNHGRDTYECYRKVSGLWKARGDLRTAGALLDRAVAMGRARIGATPLWLVYHTRGQVRMAQGNFEGALADFGAAVDLARRWRLEALPADAVRVGMEVGLEDLYSGYIEAAGRLYRRRPSAALLRGSFEAAEDNRAASLRALITDRGDSQRGLPDQYGETLARLRKTEVALLRGESPAVRREAQRLRAELTEMETRAGLDSERAEERADPAGLLARTRQALERDEAFLSFHLGGAESYLWAVTREGAHLRTLGGRKQIAEQCREFTEAVRSDSPAATELGEKLYGALFGGLPQEVVNKRHWALAVEDALFSTPLAALVVERGESGPVYLVERHSTRLVPSAHEIANRRAEAAQHARTGRFVGLGDPVYNTADPRWRGPRLGEPNGETHLARLPGSGREIRACAAAWDGAAAPLLLEGAGASRADLVKALQGTPSVLHLATHVVSQRTQSGKGLLALALLPNGQPDFVTATDIAALRGRVDLVVLSGCGTGLGEALPGAGLMGLTRAWLAAGASNVAATLWPTPDDSGDLFLSFYRSLHEQRRVAPAGHAAAAVALAHAQAGAARRQAWRNHPQYWAGYFLFGRE